MEKRREISVTNSFFKIIIVCVTCAFGLGALFASLYGTCVTDTLLNMQNNHLFSNQEDVFVLFILNSNYFVCIMICLYQMLSKYYKCFENLLINKMHGDFKV